MKTANAENMVKRLSSSRPTALAHVALNVLRHLH